jgi:hypothetical protein
MPERGNVTRNRNSYALPHTPHTATHTHRRRTNCRELLASREILVRNSYLVSRNFAIGSGTYGNVTNVTVEDTRIGDAFGSAPWAIKIKSHCPSGGVVSNITFRRLNIGRIAPNSYQQPHGGMVISMYEDYGGGCGKTLGANGAGPTPAPTQIENITFQDISAIGAVWASNPIEGVEATGGAPIRGLRFDNVSFGNVSAAQPWLCSNVVGTIVAGRVEPPLPAECGVTK